MSCRGPQGSEAALVMTVNIRPCTLGDAQLFMSTSYLLLCYILQSVL
jgi:hypothetical protein